MADNLYMDDKDSRILDELSRNSRQSTAFISRSTGIPRVTVHDRLDKLKKNGVIKRFTVELDYAKLGLPVTALALVTYDRSAHMDQHEVARKIIGLSGVYEVQIISGQWDFLVKIRAASINDVGMLIIDNIRKLDGVNQTLTMAVFETVKE